MGEPIFKAVTLDRLYGPSLRQQATDTLRAEGEALIAEERHRKIAQRESSRAARRQNRANAVGWRAYRHIPNGDHEYVDCLNGRTRIRIAEDENGDLLFPRDASSCWYEPLRWWKPLHWAGWIRTRQTGELVMVESE